MNGNIPVGMMVREFYVRTLLGDSLFCGPEQQNAAGNHQKG